MIDSFEAFLPPYLKTSIENMKKSWAIEDNGERDIHWDLYWGELNADKEQYLHRIVYSTE